VNKMQANQMVTSKQNSVARTGANHKETCRPIKEQHVFDFHSHIDDIWQMKVCMMQVPRFSNRKPRSKQLASNMSYFHGI
jgi:hypothetical protein